MNLFERIYSSHQTDHSHAHGAPFWVRFYDPIVQFVSLGKTRQMHQATLGLAKLQPDESLLDIGCGTGSLILEAENNRRPSG